MLGVSRCSDELVSGAAAPWLQRQRHADASSTTAPGEQVFVISSRFGFVLKGLKNKSEPWRTKDPAHAAEKKANRI